MSTNTPKKKTTTNGNIRAEATLSRRKQVLREGQRQEVLPLEEDLGGKVAVQVGMSENLGDFNNLKISVVVSRPCKPTAEDELRVGREAFKSADAMYMEFRKAMLPETKPPVE